MRGASPPPKNEGVPHMLLSVHYVDASRIGVWHLAAIDERFFADSALPETAQALRQALEDARSALHHDPEAV